MSEGKQFDGMIHADKNALSSATRDAVLTSSAAKLGLIEPQAVTVRSSSGAYTGRVSVARVKPGNIQVHWPEGNGLLDAHKRSLERARAGLQRVGHARGDRVNRGDF